GAAFDIQRQLWHQTTVHREIATAPLSEPLREDAE
ncbi:unnamed protein product, partial [marine sediment metagenome]